jgi:hypothetical protein
MPGGAPGEDGGAPGSGGTDPGTGGSGGTLGEAGNGPGGQPGNETGGTSSGGSPSGGAPSGGTGGTTGGTATGGMPAGPLSSCPTGCAKLQVPLSGESDKANFVLFLGNPINFSSAVLRFRIYKEAGVGGEFKGYIQHSGSDYDQLFGPAHALDELDGWEELPPWDVGAHATSFNKTNVTRVGVQIIGWNSSEWSNPTIVYLDWMVADNTATSQWNFESAGRILTSPATSANAGTLFINNGDSPVAGAQLSWLGE